MLFSNASPYFCKAIVPFLKTQEGVWEWVTGEDWAYTAWNSGQPDNYQQIGGIEEDYLQLLSKSYNYEWNDSANTQDSTAKIGFICEWDNESSTTEPTPIAEGKFGGHRYALYDTGAKWAEAKSFCESLGGHLVTITSSEEQTFIEKLLSDGSKLMYWTGGLKADSGWTCISSTPALIV